jgi:hypothetical protein
MLYYTFATKMLRPHLLLFSSALTQGPGLSLPSGLLGIASLVLNTPFLPFLSGVVPNSLYGTGLWLALSLAGVTPLTNGEGLEGILDELPR